MLVVEYRVVVTTVPTAQSASVVPVITYPYATTASPIPSVIVAVVAATCG